MFAVGGGERSATTSERLLAKCLPTTLQVLFGLILDDGLSGSYSGPEIRFSGSKRREVNLRRLAVRATRVAGSRPGRTRARPLPETSAVSALRRSVCC
jgi:hypothetical protein